MEPPSFLLPWGTGAWEEGENLVSELTELTLWLAAAFPEREFWWGDRRRPLEQLKANRGLEERSGVRGARVR